MTTFFKPGVRRLRCAVAQAAFGVIISATTVAAQETQIGPDSYAVKVQHLGIHPRTEAEARHTLHLLDAAAMAVCGASDVSLQEIKVAVRASPCWKNAMTEALKRIGDPILARAYDGRPLRPVRPQPTTMETAN